MTVKEKAKELVEVFWIEVEDNEYPTRKMSLNQAKQCALIAVDEVINSIKCCNECNEDASIEMAYWGGVKREIEKL